MKILNNIVFFLEKYNIYDPQPTCKTKNEMTLYDPKTIFRLKF